MSNPQKITVHPGKLQNIFCSDKDCESPFFDRVYVLKKIPQTISPTGRAIIQPIEIYVCRDCRGVIGELLPEGAVVEKLIETKNNEIN